MSVIVDHHDPHARVELWPRMWAGVLETSQAPLPVGPWNWAAKPPSSDAEFLPAGPRRQVNTR